MTRSFAGVQCRVPLNPRTLSKDYHARFFRVAKIPFSHPARVSPMKGNLALAFALSAIAFALSRGRFDREDLSRIFFDRRSSFVSLSLRAVFSDEKAKRDFTT